MSLPTRGAPHELGGRLQEWHFDPAGSISREGPPRSRDRLAGGTEVRRAVQERLAPDRGAAAPARQPFPAVGVQRAVEVARLGVDVDIEGVEAGPALPEAAPITALASASTRRTWMR